MEEKIAFSTSSTGATGQSQMKNSHYHLNLCLTPYTKINSKLITNLNVKHNTKKLYGEKKKTSNRLGEISCKPYISQVLLSRTYKEFSKLNSKKQTIQLENGLKFEETVP